MYQEDYLLCQLSMPTYWGINLINMCCTSVILFYLWYSRVNVFVQVSYSKAVQKIFSKSVWETENDHSFHFITWSFKLSCKTFHTLWIILHCEKQYKNKFHALRTQELCFYKTNISWRSRTKLNAFFSPCTAIKKISILIIYIETNL